MKLSVLNKYRKYAWPTTLIGGIIAFGLSYFWWARPLYLTQEPQGFYWKSPVTANMILLLGLWGYLSDVYSTKRWGKSSKQGWILFGMGLFILFLFYKYVLGLPARF